MSCRPARRPAREPPAEAGPANQLAAFLGRAVWAVPDSAGFAQDAEPFRRELLAHCYCVLTVTDTGIRRISSFGDPRLVTVFGFGPDMAQAKDAEPAPSGA